MPVSERVVGTADDKAASEEQQPGYGGDSALELRVKYGGMFSVRDT